MGSCAARIVTSDAVMMYMSKSKAQEEMRYRPFVHDERVKGRDSSHKCQADFVNEEIKKQIFK